MLTVLSREGDVGEEAGRLEYAAFRGDDARRPPRSLPSPLEICCYARRCSKPPGVVMPLRIISKFKPYPVSFS